MMFEKGHEMHLLLLTFHQELLISVTWCSECERVHVHGHVGRGDVINISDLKLAPFTSVWKSAVFFFLFSVMMMS